MRPPTTILRWSSVQHNGYTDGKEVLAQPLSIRPGGLAGSGASYRSPLYEIVSQRKKSGKSVYVQGHLLNHHLFGTGGDVKNLTPIPSLDNGKMERDFESEAKDMVLDDNKVIAYHVTVDYGSRTGRTNIPEENYLATHLNFELYEMQLDPGKVTTAKTLEEIDKLKADERNWIIDPSVNINYSKGFDITLPPDTKISDMDKKVECTQLDLQLPIPPHFSTDDQTAAKVAAKAYLRQVPLIGDGTAEDLLAKPLNGPSDIQKILGTKKTWANFVQLIKGGALNIVHGGGSIYKGLPSGSSGGGSSLSSASTTLSSAPPPATSAPPPTFVPPVVPPPVVGPPIPLPAVGPPPVAATGAGVKRARSPATDILQQIQAYYRGRGGGEPAGIENWTETQLRSHAALLGIDIS